ncbi:L-type lectin-domain containing receptor kinase IX.1 [Populus trichocarpa]|uniref:L-type lectin-domain containing receptor kinase IX.1 n=1 Tax=Populus trichocarpa TaxID=3694 RepID=UPI00227946E6|nr:L-type lectin-domain containing receptor kinase IX.1 [Populus trichocarpa]
MVGNNNKKKAAVGRQTSGTRNLLLVVEFCWSTDGGEFLLAYGYMSNGKSKKCVMHCGIKSTNVILDSKCNAILGDFGAAMFLDQPDLALQTRKMVGTFGCVAPGFYYQGRAAKEADVYSFGVLVLEIACGIRKHKDEESHLGLVEWFWELYGAGNVLESAGESVHPTAKQRPKISQAIEVLKLEVAKPNLPFEMAPFFWELEHLILLNQAFRPPLLSLENGLRQHFLRSQPCNNTIGENVGYMLFASKLVDQGL